MRGAKRKDPQGRADRVNRIAMTVFAVVAIAAGIVWTEIERKQAEEARYIDSWPITVNQHVELGWAGKGCS